MEGKKSEVERLREQRKKGETTHEAVVQWLDAQRPSLHPFPSPSSYLFLTDVILLQRIWWKWEAWKSNYPLLADLNSNHYVDTELGEFLLSRFLIRMKFTVLSDEHNRFFSDLCNKHIVTKITAAMDSEGHPPISRGLFYLLLPSVFACGSLFALTNFPFFLSHDILVKSISAIFISWGAKGPESFPKYF